MIWRMVFTQMCITTMPNTQENWEIPIRTRVSGRSK